MRTGPPALHRQADCLSAPWRPQARRVSIRPSAPPRFLHRQLPGSALPERRRGGGDRKPARTTRMTVDGVQHEERGGGGCRAPRPGAASRPPAGRRKPARHHVLARAVVADDVVTGACRRSRSSSARLPELSSSSLNGPGPACAGKSRWTARPGRTRSAGPRAPPPAGQRREEPPGRGPAAERRTTFCSSQPWFSWLPGHSSSCRAGRATSAGPRRPPAPGAPRCRSGSRPRGTASRSQGRLGGRAGRGIADEQ